MVFKRQTKISDAVLQLLGDATHPLSINQIIEQLVAVHLSPNRTTVYRIMDKLVQQDVAAVITVNNGISYFELSKKGDAHHHHFFCNVCYTLFCLASCHVDQHDIDLTRFLPNKGFEITGHDFNLYGICAPCSM